MQLCLYLTPELIISPLKGNSKDEIIRELTFHLAQQKNLRNSEVIYNAVIERERTSSTFLPSGIAIPHARVTEVDDIVVCMGISNHPIQDDGSQNNLTARLFCLFLSPTMDKEFGRHLKLLARISAMFSDPDFINEVIGIGDPKQIFEALQKRERALDEAS